MIDNKSFDLYNKLVKDNHYHELFDITIIYQVNCTLEASEVSFDEESKKRLYNEVKRQYLKYDYDLNDDLVLEVMKEMGFINE